jgi:NADH-quinone oxidoreductase subunit L
MGFLGIIQNDIKRVVAYSTLSQLGYMTVALGASAYSVAIFHLMTHAFFKALLFLAAGSVIIGMHHDQDIRNMGGLRKYMPITWITSLIGSLALIGTPFLSGFYSKDSIIEAVALSHIPGSGFAYFAVLAGVFVTAFYSFRMYFLVFHGEERFGKADDAHHHEHDGDHDDEETSHDHHHGLAPGQKPHETPWVVWLPLVLLAIPRWSSVTSRWPMLAATTSRVSPHREVSHTAFLAFHPRNSRRCRQACNAFTSLRFSWRWLASRCPGFFYMKRPTSRRPIQRRSRRSTRFSKTSTTSTISTRPSSPLARACSARCSARCRRWHHRRPDSSMFGQGGRWVRPSPAFQTGYVYPKLHHDHRSAGMMTSVDQPRIA